MNFAEFKKVVENNLKITKTEAESLILPILRKLPAPTVTVNPNTYIERAVKVNKADSPFDLSRLSYIPEDKKALARPGRFNREAESIFYGAFTDLEDPQMTRYYLACEIEQNLQTTSSSCQFKFSTSKWLTIGSFPAILFIFDVKYCGSKLIKEAYDEFQTNSDYLKLSVDEKEALRLITAL